MRISGNPIERTWGVEACTTYFLHENGKSYEYNKFMEFWETRDGKKRFYRFLTEEDKKNMKELENYYYNSFND